MAFTLNLAKSEQAFRLNLKKRGITTIQPAEVAFDLDVSGSYRDEHEDGTTQLLLNRIVPVGMVFDPDKKIDVFTFSNGPEYVYHVGDITPETVDGYIKKNIIDRVPGWNGGTHYSHVIRKNLEHFGWLPQGAAPQKKQRLFGRMFGVFDAQTAAPVLERKRSIVILNTDGDNNDEEETYQLLKESEARKDEIYFIFLAYANGGAQFPFLHKVADDFSNTGLIEIDNLKEFVNKTDEEINDLLLGDELVAWLKK